MARRQGLSIDVGGGGSVDVVDLPDAGLKGNSHMIMMDKNSGQVADLIQKWLVSKGLVRLTRRSPSALACCAATCGRANLADAQRYPATPNSSELTWIKTYQPHQRYGPIRLGRR